MGLFKEALAKPSDIQMHLGLLHGLACHPDVKRIFEIGVREGLSTAALCASGKPVTSVDIAPCEPHATKLRIAYPNWTFIQEHSLQTELFKDLREVDLLFIDGEHTYRTVRAELCKFAPMVWKWIALHDTHTFASKGKDGTTPGLQDAILDFMNNDQDGEWEYVLNLTHNNGITLLGRR